MMLSKEDTRSLEAPSNSMALRHASPTTYEGEGRDTYTPSFASSGKSILWSELGLFAMCFVGKHLLFTRIEI